MKRPDRGPCTGFTCNLLAATGTTHGLCERCWRGVSAAVRAVQARREDAEPWRFVWGTTAQLQAALAGGMPVPEGVRRLHGLAQLGEERRAVLVPHLRRLAELLGAEYPLIRYWRWAFSARLGGV